MPWEAGLLSVIAKTDIRPLVWRSLGLRACSQVWRMDPRAPRNNVVDR